MIKEFVTYEQALALKELGFDEQCFMLYQIDTENKDLQKPMDDKYWGYYSDPRDWNSFDFLPYKPFCKCMSAPLKQQVFRWFRDKHGYNTEIVWMTAIDFGYSARVKSKLGTVYIGGCDTYEEAEDGCINKLIEILKYIS